MTARVDESDVKMRAVTCGGLCALAILVGLLVLVEAGLQAEENVCGQRKCRPKEYCRDNDNICQPCSEVCETNSNNYQQKTCDTQCQDYMHEKWFVPRKEVTATEDIRSVLTRLTVLVIVTLVVSVIVLLLLIVVVAVLIWHRRKQNKKSPIYLESNGNNNGNVNYKSEPLKLDVTATVPPSSTTTAPPPVTPATTSTPLSMRPRYPKEDPTLEYGAYDNPALTPSPVFENNQPETTPVGRRQESSF